MNKVIIMNERTKNVAIARETLDIIKNKSYLSTTEKQIDLAEALDFSVKNTKHYIDDLPDVEHLAGEEITPSIEVVNEKAFSAAVRLLAAEKTNLALLNFASATNQGGGFLGGSRAQEEDLCRCSGLYACLKSKPMFYNHNNRLEDTFYTHDILYSPSVPFFRNDQNVLIDEVVSLSVITAPAPYVANRPDEDEAYDERLLSTLVHRAKKVLKVAAMHGHRNIILGAWGCGAFGNDPVVVANVFKEALSQMKCFEQVCFAVYDTREETPLYNVFKEICEA